MPKQAIHVCMQCQYFKQAPSILSLKGGFTQKPSTFTSPFSVLPLLVGNGNLNVRGSHCSVTVTYYEEPVTGCNARIAVLLMNQ